MESTDRVTDAGSVSQSDRNEEENPSEIGDAIAQRQGHRSTAKSGDGQEPQKNGHEDLPEQITTAAVARSETDPESPVQVYGEFGGTKSGESAAEAAVDQAELSGGREAAVGVKDQGNADDRTATADEAGDTQSPGESQGQNVDRVTIPVLPFGGNRFAEISYEKMADGRMQAVFNDFMAVVREEEILPGEDENEAGGRTAEEKDPATEVSPKEDLPLEQEPASVPKSDASLESNIVPDEPPATALRSGQNTNPDARNDIGTDPPASEGPLTGDQLPEKVPEAPTIIMQIPTSQTPVVRFALRKIPSHISVPSVYDILDLPGGGRRGARTRGQLGRSVDGVHSEFNRAIMALPLLPLRALPPIQRSYRRYNGVQTAGDYQQFFPGYNQQFTNQAPAGYLAPHNTYVPLPKTPLPLYSRSLRGSQLTSTGTYQQLSPPHNPYQSTHGSVQGPSSVVYIK